MDISRNMIDLLYLTNHINMEKINRCKTEKTFSFKDKKNIKKLV